MQSFQSANNPVTKFLAGELGREVFIEGVKETYENGDFTGFSQYQMETTSKVHQSNLHIVSGW